MKEEWFKSERGEEMQSKEDEEIEGRNCEGERKGRMKWQGFKEEM